MPTLSIDTLSIFCTASISIGLLYYICRLIQNTRLQRTLAAVSKGIMPFYIIQRGIIGRIMILRCVLTDSVEFVVESVPLFPPFAS